MNACMNEEKSTSIPFHIIIIYALNVFYLLLLGVEEEVREELHAVASWLRSSGIPYRA
jgi:hypothetical protein